MISKFADTHTHTVYILYIYIYASPIVKVTPNRHITGMSSESGHAAAWLSFYPVISKIHKYQPIFTMSMALYYGLFLQLATPIVEVTLLTILLKRG